MFDTNSEIIKTLETLNDYYYAISNYLIFPKHKKLYAMDIEPFHRGFLCSIEKRKELSRRLNKLEKTEKTILLLFYTFSKSIDYIGQELNLSCRQCYRIKKRAIDKIISLNNEEEVYIKQL